MSKARLAISGLALSAAAFVGILTREGYTDTAVIPTKGDVPTVGFGTTGGVRMGDRTTPVKAAQRALADVAKFEGAIKQCVTMPLNQTEYDVYTDLAYNIGPANFCTNRKTGGPGAVPLRLNAGKYREACDAILLYKFAGGNDCSIPGNRICAGVWTDRLRLHAKCLEAQ